MLDLHCHILPGVDDGAVDLAESMQMAREAIDQGCRAVCATSHLWEQLFDTSPELNAQEHAHLVTALRREGIELEVFPGAENFLAEDVTPESFAEVAVVLREGPYVLFDFSMRSLPDVSAAVRALEAVGKRAVIAHPERNALLQADPSPVGTWIDLGAVIQVNAPSILGRHGREAQETADLLLASGAVHAVASDAHGPRRPFCLGEARAALTEVVGKETAELLCRENPWRIARGEEVPTESVVIQIPSRTARFFRRLRG